MWAMCFRFTQFPRHRENVYTLPCYHHQIGSMNYYPLFRVRSWNNGMRCMSLYSYQRIMNASAFRNDTCRYAYMLPIHVVDISLILNIRNYEFRQTLREFHMAFMHLLFYEATIGVGIDHVFAPGTVFGRATTHEWSRPSLPTSSTHAREGKLSSEHILRRVESVKWFIPSLCTSRKLSEVCMFNLWSEIWQSNRGVPMAIVMVSNLHNCPWVVLLKCTAL